jgi:hypothetical protein
VGVPGRAEEVVCPLLPAGDRHVVPEVSHRTDAWPPQQWPKRGRLPRCRWSFVLGDKTTSCGQEHGTILVPSQGVWPASQGLELADAVCRCQGNQEHSLKSEFSQREILHGVEDFR